MFRILFIGDIVGSAARGAVADLLPRLRKQYEPNYVIANGENAAAGFGITKAVYEQLVYDYSIDMVTSGNHVWDKKEIFKQIEFMDYFVRPLNYPNSMHGVGWRLVERNGVRLAVVNLMGRVFVNPALDCPFQAIDKLLATQLKDKADIIFVDFHAETTSEKKAMGHFLDGRVSAVIGTHTHVQTNDAQLLPGGTAYLTDAGMVGPVNSVLGMQSQIAIKRFTTGINERFEVEDSGKIEFSAVVVDIDEATGKALEIKLVKELL